MKRFFLSLILLLAVVSNGFAAVALDALFTGGDGDSGRCQLADDATTCSDTNGITVGVGATLLVAVIHAQNNGPGPTSMAATWDGVAMTAGPTIGNSGAGNFGSSAIFYLVNPASGAKTLTISWTNAADAYMSAASFTGVDTTTPVVTGDNVTGTSGSTVTVTSTTDGATLAIWGTNGSDPTTNFNEIFSTAPLDPGAGASYQLGGTSNAHTFTGGGGSIPTMAGIHINASAAAPTTGPIFYYYRSLGVCLFFGAPIVIFLARRKRRT